MMRLTLNQSNINIFKTPEICYFMSDEQSTAKTMHISIIETGLFTTPQDINRKSNRTNQSFLALIFDSPNSFDIRQSFELMLFKSFLISEKLN